LTLYDTAPVDQRWYGGLYGARADLVAAQVYADQLDDAADQMEQLLVVPVELRTNRLVQRARRVQGMVAGRRFQGGPVASRLIGQTEVFVADAAASRALPPATP
jgi:hypothetical protein